MGKLTGFMLFFIGVGMVLGILITENSHDLDGYKGNPNYRHYDFSANDAMLTNYIIIGNWNNQQVFVKFTPNERLLDDMFRISPGKVRRR